MGVVKSTIGSKMGRKFGQKRKAKWVKKKLILVKAYTRVPNQGSWIILNSLFELSKLWISESITDSDLGS